MPQFRALLWCLIALSTVAVGRLAAQTATSFKASPATISVSYQEGDAKLPATQTVAVSGVAGTGIAVALSAGPWLAVSPTAATLPASLKVLANPTSLAVGTYSGTITITTSGANPLTASVAVTLVVKPAPSSLGVSANPVSISFVRGGPPPPPTPLNLTSTGAVLSYSLTTAGGSWLTVTPKSGIVFPAFPAELTLAVNPAGLAPGSYKATITVAAPQAANKTQTVTVNLNVGPGVPTLSTIWPTKVIQGAASTTVTLTGTNFAPTSVIKAGTTTLTATILGPDAATAVLPTDLLLSPALLPITVSNPGTGGGDSAAVSFLVAPATPVISAVVNAASFLDGPVAPGQMVTIFGSFLGPDTLASFAAPAPGASIATTLGGTTVYFDTTPAPIIFTSAKQVAALVPYDVAGKSVIVIRLEKDGVASESISKNVAPASPALFTAAGSGSGQAAAFIIDEATGAITLNSENSAATKGGVVVLYATGEGVTSPPSLDGRIVTAGSSTINPTLALQIGGANATVLYAGGVPGLVAGLLQINARIPSTITAAKATPVVLTINGISSSPGVTIAIK